MSNGLKFMIIAVGTIITCIIVVVGFQIAKTGKNDTKNASEEYGSIATQFDVLKDYDGRTITGNEIIDLMEEYQDEELFMLVKTKSSEAIEGMYYNRSRDLSDIAGIYDSSTKSKTDPEYINEFAIFSCTTYMNENGIVIGMRFVQN